MSLLDVRKQFIDLTGRTDLVVDLVDYADNGADAYINRGQRYLDRTLVEPVGGYQFNDVSIATGSYVIFVPRCLSVEGVILFNEDKEFIKHLVLTDAAGVYRKVDAGIPKYYAVGAGLIEGSVVDLSKLSIVIVPAANIDYILRVYGMFITPTLDGGDESISYWTEEQPTLLSLAAAYVLAFTYANKTLASTYKDWMDEAIRSIYKQNALSASAGIGRGHVWGGNYHVDT